MKQVIVQLPMIPRVCASNRSVVADAIVGDAVGIVVVVVALLDRWESGVGNAVTESSWVGDGTVLELSGEDGDDDDDDDDDDDESLGFICVVTG